MLMFGKKRVENLFGVFSVNLNKNTVQNHSVLGEFEDQLGVWDAHVEMEMIGNRTGKVGLTFWDCSKFIPAEGRLSVSVTAVGFSSCH